MKKRSMVVGALLVAMAVLPTAQAKKALPEGGAEAATAETSAVPSAQLPDRRYWNGDWYVHEFKSGSYSQRTLSAPGLPSMTMPRTVNVCFSTKRNCESANPGTDPEAHFSIMNMKSIEQMLPPSMRKKMPAPEAPAPKGPPPTQGCDTLEQTTVKWAGVGAQWMAMRCPEEGAWRYTASAFMQRKSTRGEDTYSLMCTMRSKSKDKEGSMAEFRENLRPRCQKMIQTTQFLP
jgi:hypothetical protein